MSKQKKKNEQRIVDNFGYVYLTTCLKTGKKYVGQRRKPQFDKKYIGGGRLLQTVIDIYGRAAFKTEVLHWCKSQKELNEWERNEIFFYNTLSPNGYNLEPGGKHPSGKRAKHPIGIRINNG